MKQDRLSIIHFNPIEQYPPVMNLLEYFAAEVIDFNVDVYTMTPPANLQKYSNPSPKIRIHRKGNFTSNRGLIVRMLNYFQYYVSVSLHLARLRPAVLLSFETLSFLPAYIYKNFISREVSLMIHYHEYMSPEEIKRGMKLNSWLHKLEIKMYPETVWVSHTNTDRMNKFLSDNRNVSIPNTYILPNYPSKNWGKQNSGGVEGLIKVAYVGSLSLDTMFTREFAEWVFSQQGAVEWDIYANNISEEVITYINSLPGNLVKFKGACDYKELPQMLVNYHVGVILYKGHIPNYIYNAPNKLFEYLACGLDVWVPDVMKGCKPYLTKNTWPKVTALNFSDLKDFKPKDLTSKHGLIYMKPAFYYEAVLDKLLLKIRSLLSFASKPVNT